MLSKSLLTLALSVTTLFLVNLERCDSTSPQDATKKNSLPKLNTTTEKVPLSSSAVSEGACVVDPPIAFLNPLMWAIPRKYYIPIASEYAFRRFAEIFLGRSAHSEEELEKMCLNLDLFGFSFKTYGYGEYLGQTFLSWDFITSFNWGIQKCYPEGVSSDIVQKSYVDDYTDNLVLTDNETFGMFVRCVNGVKDFKVLTTSPEVDEKLLEKIKEKAVSLGFDAKLVRTLNCKQKESEHLKESDSRDEL